MPVDALLAGLAFVFGTVMGSFANVLVIRLKDASSIWGRSRCIHCGVAIKPHHLVPVLSWFLLQGRCADCGKPIHPMYPAVEAAAGILMVVAYVRHPDVLSPSELSRFLFEGLLAVDLLVLVAFDFRWQLLPIEFMGGSAILFALWNIVAGSLPWTSVAIGVAVGSGFLAAQVLLSKGKWMGSGDPWAGALAGAALGWPGIGFGLYLTYIVGGILAAVLLVAGAVKRSTRIPFVPLLSAGTMAALWFGPSLQTWLSRLIAG